MYCKFNITPQFIKFKLDYVNKRSCMHRSIKKTNYSTHIPQKQKLRKSIHGHEKPNLKLC